MSSQADTENTPKPTVSLGDAWRLVRPYWFSEDKWKARGLLAVIVALALGQVGLNVLFNSWYNTFYNALQDKKLDVFTHQIIIFSGLAAAFIVVAVYQQYLTQMLQIRWRNWITQRYTNAWLTQQNYYRLQVLTHAADNPDQRIAEDLALFTGAALSKTASDVLTLGIQFLSAVVTLVSFVTILWNLSGPLTVPIFGGITIPGYMVWAAILYAIIGTWLTHLIGRKLVRLDYDQQRFEADFRFNMVRLRENAESIAFYRGEAAERQRLFARFNKIVGNWWEIMRKQKQLNWFTAGYGQAAIIFPFVVGAPRYFAGAIQLGGLMQIASAFGQVQNALSWFIEFYPRLASWKATTERLHRFHTAMDASQAEAGLSAIRLGSGGAALAVRGLALRLPGGGRLGNPLDFTVQPGGRLMLSGPSGSGKTTLLRALAGLWPYGEGEVAMPEGARVLFVPQKPYLPIGTLRAAISYPNAEPFGDAEVKRALEAAGVAYLAPLLDTEDHWAQRLSPGEQQKVAFARVLLQAPDVLLLDEATAALDEAAEASLYAQVFAALPRAIVVSVSHKTGVRALHTAVLDIGAGA